MLLLDFSPYVLPHVNGCPLPTLEQHVRMAAIEFCRRTLCYTRTLDPMPTDGTGFHEVAVPPDTQIIKFKAAALDGKSIEVVPTVRGLALVRSQHPGEFCFTQDNTTLRLVPAPLAGTVCEVDAALAPSITATGIDDLIAAEHLQDIAQGAIASIKRIAGQEFTDLNGSALFESMYRARISTISAKVARGLAASKMPSYGQFV